MYQGRAYRCCSPLPPLSFVFLRTDKASWKFFWITAASSSSLAEEGVAAALGAGFASPSARPDINCSLAFFSLSCFHRKLNAQSTITISIKSILLVTLVNGLASFIATIGPPNQTSTAIAIIPITGINQRIIIFSPILKTSD